MADTPLVVQVAVGRPREIPGPQGRPTSTAIAKEPREGRVAVGAENLDGDEQADREHHGGPDKAVYAYASEDVAWWRGELDRDVDPQTFGQNLTTSGLDLRAAVVGERWRVGSAEFEVAQPRIPCVKLGLHAADPSLPKRFVAAVRPGAYLRVARRGDVGAGDAIEVVHRPDHGVTLAEVFRIRLHEPDRAAELLRAPELAAGVLAWARGRG